MPKKLIIGDCEQCGHGTRWHTLDYDGEIRCKYHTTERWHSISGVSGINVHGCDCSTPGIPRNWIFVNECQ